MMVGAQRGYQIELRRPRGAAVGLLAVLVPTVAPATVLNVPTAYPTINAALAVAVAGDTVLVAPGTYTQAETRVVDLGGTFLETVTSLAFLVDGVALVSEAGPGTTILDLSQSVIVGDPIVVAGGLLLQPIAVDGFTLTGTPPTGGAGLFVQFCQLVTVSNCVFLNTDDGALQVSESVVSVNNCEFYDCQAFAGGAIGVANSSLTVTGGVVQGCEDPIFVDAQMSTPTYSVVIQDCTFIGNSSTANTGCILIRGSGYASVAIERCWFEDSQAMLGGGAVSTNPDLLTPVTIRDNVFVRCQANGPPFCPVGGAILLGNDGVNFIERNTFHECGVSESAAAAAIGILSLLPTTLRNNVFTGSLGAPAIEAFGGTVISSCNVFWDNALGDVTGFSLSSTDRIVDPLYCDPTNDDLTVARDSPCLLAHSLGCGQIGARGEGCGPVSLRPMSWGAIKGGYRR